ncbi:MAG: hypothetical protein WBX09_11640 [Terracidiphilus sp.]
MITSNGWLQQRFGSAKAKNGGVVIVSRASIRRFASESDLADAVRKIGGMLVMNRNHYIIFCNREALRFIP